MNETKSFADVFYERHPELDPDFEEHLTYCKFVEFDEAVSCGHGYMRNPEECRKCWDMPFRVEDESEVEHDA
jgi:hypothetical protein